MIRTITNTCPTQYVSDELCQAIIADLVHFLVINNSNFMKEIVITFPFLKQHKTLLVGKYGIIYQHKNSYKGRFNKCSGTEE